MSAESEFILTLVRRGVVTLEDDPERPGTHCGMERDADGFCENRSYHPILFKPEPKLPEWAFACHACGADVGQPCDLWEGQTYSHTARMNAWAESQA